MKIFNCHFTKCGTHSLTAALKILGFKGYHGWIKGRYLARYYSKNGFSGIPRFDFLSDFGNTESNIVLEIEKEYPNPKFILTTREINSRMVSIKKQRIREGNINKYDREWHEAHHYRILDFYENHFKDKDNLLVLPTETDNKWKLLCTFLHKPIPNVPYPKKHVAARLR